MTESEPVESSTAKYEPQAGDVVDFEYKGEILQALIYFDNMRDELASLDSNASSSHYWRLAKELKNPRKIGETDVLLKCNDHCDARPIAKKYFVAQQESKYKVSDLVELCAVSYGAKENLIGTTALVTKVLSDGDVNVIIQGNDYTDVQRPHCIKPLSGSYSERQGKFVEYHKLEVGSKVRMVRPNERNEDGSYTIKHTQRLFDRKDTDNCTIKRICSDYISIESSDFRGWHVPYCVLEPVKD